MVIDFTLEAVIDTRKLNHGVLAREGGRDPLFRESQFAVRFDLEGVSLHGALELAWLRWDGWLSFFGEPEKDVAICHGEIKHELAGLLILVCASHIALETFVGAQPNDILALGIVPR